MEREHHTCHLSFLIGEKEAGLLVHTGRSGLYLGKELIRFGVEEPAEEGECVYADIKHRAACEIPVEEAVLHVVLFETAEVHRDQIDSAETAGVENFFSSL